MRKNRKIIFLLAFICFFANSLAQKKNMENRPRLIVNIAIDGLRSDYISLFWNHFSQDGFRRLITNGFYSKNMCYPYLNLGNSADYASVFTGTFPSDHGISGDTYYDLKSSVELSYLNDKVKGVNGDEKVSPVNLVASTFTDELKVNTQGKAKVITIALNAAEAVIMAGHAGDGTVWIDDKSGHWMSSSFYGAKLPDFAILSNYVNQDQSNMLRNWSNLYVGSNYTVNSAQSGISSFFAYPMKETLGSDNSYRKYKQSPFANTDVRELVERVIKSEALGVDEVTDVLNIQLSVRGFDQANSGVLTAEIQDMYLRVDNELKKIIDQINDNCGESKVLYMVFSPQTEYCSPEDMKRFKIPSGYFYVDRSLALLNTHLMALYGQQVDFVKGFANRQLYIDREEIIRKEMNVDDVINKITDFMGRFEGVQYAIRSEELNTLGSSDSRIQKAKNSYNRNKSGDIILFLQPGWVDVPNDQVKIGISTRVNNNAPFVLSGWKVKPQVYEKPFSAIDVAPSICNILNISFPSSNMGTPLIDILE